MQATNIQWSDTEQQVAQIAFQAAYERETEAIKRTVQERAEAITELNDLWQLHDFLSARRHDIDGKYDYDYQGLLFVFARLIQEGWLGLDELAGLEANKLAKITALSRMSAF